MEERSRVMRILAWPVKADGYTEWQYQGWRGGSNDTDTSRIVRPSVRVWAAKSGVYRGCEGRAKSRHWAKAGRTRGNPPGGNPAARPRAAPGRLTTDTHRGPQRGEVMGHSSRTGEITKGTSLVNFPSLNSCKILNFVLKQEPKNFNYSVQRKNLILWEQEGLNFI